MNFLSNRSVDGLVQSSDCFGQPTGSVVMVFVYTNRGSLFRNKHTVYDNYASEHFVAITHSQQHMMSTRLSVCL